MVRENGIVGASIELQGKKTVARQMVRENGIVGASIELQGIGDWTFWEVRPSPKRKKEQKIQNHWSPCYTRKH
jgi:hypothetical protein